MRIVNGGRTVLCAAVVAGGLVCTGSRAQAQPQVDLVTPPAQTRTPGLNNGAGAGSGMVAGPSAPLTASPRSTIPLDPPSVFPYTPYADHPHPGEPEAPSIGQPHYPQPFWRYTHWYRPKAANLTAFIRCTCPDPFRPRGYGNLFAQPCIPYRMEYDPYVIIDERNQYGPSYFVRHPNQFCSSHHHWTR
jgi:hypothetical protein